METSRVELGRRFPGILDAELNADATSCARNFRNGQDCFEALQARLRNAGASAVQACAQRKAEREKIATGRDEQGNLARTRNTNTIFRQRMKAMNAGRTAYVIWSKLNWRNPANWPPTENAIGNDGSKRACSTN